MSNAKRAPIPVNLVAGPLGVGKTTAINHLLGQRPADERWAVLVNEYGQIGVDAAWLEEAARPRGRQNPVEVREVAGGCICCSAGFIFEAMLVLLLQRRPDRLLIEPTGLATVSGILDTLSRPGIREAVDVRSVVALVDPTREPTDPLRVEAEDQILAADVLLANRTDLASAAQLEAFDAWAAGLFPPKRFIGRVQRGEVGLKLLDLVVQRPHREDASAAGRVEAHSHDTAHDHAREPTPEAIECGPERPVVRREHQTTLASTIGWAVWADRIFSAERVARWTDGLTSNPDLRRLKAVLRTDEGWRSLNIVDGTRDAKPSGYRRDSRLEMIWTGSSRPEPDAVERELLACLAQIA